MKTRWQDCVNLVLGIWLFFSPWILRYTGVHSAAGNAYVLGILVTLFAAWALFSPRPWEEWTNFVLGLWLIASPWIVMFHQATVATWNTVITGFVVFIVALGAVGAGKQTPAHTT